jgi:hypothetical protein
MSVAFALENFSNSNNENTQFLFPSSPSSAFSAEKEFHITCVQDDLTS